MERVRQMPLEEVAARLGLERDRYDRHKWRGAGCVLSIDGQKFYDHLALKGGGRAIDLVVHLRGGSFVDAVKWLNGQHLDPVVQPRVPTQPPAPPQVKPFQPPLPDEEKWPQVRDYLVRQRGLPATYVDALHGEGEIYASGLSAESLHKLDAPARERAALLTNAVFIRRDEGGVAIGAALRGVNPGSQFKGLASGTQRDRGWFTFVVGEGEQVERVVLVESAIDALSAAALSRQQGKTVFVSVDGAGAVPTGWLEEAIAQGQDVVAAFDADEAGERMAATVTEQFPQVRRAIPPEGKDWNEYLLLGQQRQQQRTIRPRGRRR